MPIYSIHSAEKHRKKCTFASESSLLSLKYDNKNYDIVPKEKQEVEDGENCKLPIDQPSLYKLFTKIISSNYTRWEPDEKQALIYERLQRNESYPSRQSSNRMLQDFRIPLQPGLIILSLNCVQEKPKGHKNPLIPA